MNHTHRWWSGLTTAGRKQWHKLRRVIGDVFALHIKDRSLRFTERFVAGWVAVPVLILALLLHQQGSLTDHYLEPVPVSGGEYREGIVGEVGGINPIFDGDQVSRSAERLLFSSLFRYDQNSDLVKDLAESYEISDDETTYTVQLRDDVVWHDGRSLTADDVVFTYATIQNPETDSSLAMQWEDISIEAVDERTVAFELPNRYAPFLHQLTTGIVPEHRLADVEPDRLRISSFNDEPVGSGPFQFDRISGSGEIRLSRFDDYYGSAPGLDRFTLVVFEDKSAMTSNYERGQLNAMLADNSFQLASLEQSDNLQTDQLSTTSQTFAFFNNERFSDASKRQALSYVANTAALVNAIDDNVRAADSVLRPEHHGYKPVAYEHDDDQAQELLQSAGWSHDGEAWEDDGEPLQIEIATQDSGHYRQAARQLKQQWRDFGVAAEVAYYEPDELQDERIAPRDYDVLLFALALEPDPDVYAYWHSSQADEGRNVAQYDSQPADVNLEDGRTRTDPDLRAAKYETFQSIWSEDAPAIPLYQLQYTYVSRDQVDGVDTDTIMSTDHRYHNVADWSVNTEPKLRREL